MSWYGVIPKRWEEKRVFTLFTENTENNHDLHSTKALQFRFGEIVQKKIVEKDNEYLESLKRYTVVSVDDIMVNGLNLNYDFITQRVAIVKEKGCITPAYISLRPRSNINAKYACYLLKTMDNQKILNGLGTGIRLTLGFGEFKKTLLPLPPRGEQDQIVRFLDWKVSQINKLINAKKKQIALLREQKKALISVAIPRNGDQIRFRNVFFLFKGLNITKANLVESGIPCVSYGQIHSKYGFEVIPEIHILPFVNESYLSTNQSSLMRYGDFVFADTSEDVAGSGNFTYLNSQIPVFAGYHTIIARTHIMKNYRYLAYYFDSLQFRKQIQQNVNGVKVFSITRSILKNTFIIIPTEDEQKAIVESLDGKCLYYNKLVNKITGEINLLQEYRTRLISDVVTGKIDVRNIVVPEYEKIKDISLDDNEGIEEKTMKEVVE
jgi:type I restriction enzyme S subunit